MVNGTTCMAKIGSNHRPFLLQCQHDGEIRYEFPGYNVTEAPQNSWRLPPAGEDFVYGGVLLKSRCV